MASEAALDRGKGALIGLALGDALGTNARVLPAGQDAARDRPDRRRPVRSCPRLVDGRHQHGPLPRRLTDRARRPRPPRSDEALLARSRLQLGHRDLLRHRRDDRCRASGLSVRPASRLSGSTDPDTADNGSHAPVPGGDQPCPYRLCRAHVRSAPLVTPLACTYRTTTVESANAE